MAEARAIQRTARQSPYKMRLVIDQIRGMGVNDALALLKFSKKHAAKQIEKVLKSAVANAEQAARTANESLDVDALYIKHAIVNEGPKLKRFMPAAHGPRDPDPQAHQPRRDHRGREGRTLMGQKTNPIGFRLGVTKQWRSRWFATKDYPQLLKEDDLLRKYLQGAPRARGHLRHPHRAQAGQGRRDRAHGSPGRGDRQEGRRGRQAA